jgi:hypothetical protein
MRIYIIKHKRRKDSKKFLEVEEHKEFLEIKPFEVVG